MMRTARRRYAPVAFLGALFLTAEFLLLGVCSSARAGFDYEDIFLFSRMEEAASMRDLLADPAQRGRLEALLRCLPIWQVITAELAPGEAYRHTFCFGLPPRDLDAAAGPRRMTARVFHLEFETRRNSGTGRYEVVAVRERHGASPREIPRPAIGDPVALDLLRLALQDEVIFSQLRSWLENFPQARIQDFTADPILDQVGNPALRFRIGFHHGGLAGGAATESRFWTVGYDAGAGDGSFHLEE